MSDDLQVRVNMGEITVSKDEQVIFSSIVGSCVALCLYDHVTKVGGLAHVMLPDSSMANGSGSIKCGKYVDTAVEELVKTIIKKGGSCNNIRAKIAGGANMFSHESGISIFSIGEKNVKAIKKILAEKHIPLLAEDVGKNYGRNVRFSIGSGKLVVNKKNGGEMVL